ncbi:uncharacterized protein LOC119099719 [Pollicipes pollicipes]|uniref:uncharacterized protein LOC119099719 n=1 Tax=Pollicipes pollicipes TaxID=41117 RepID=UPI001885501A|nr:uncharacterized protein LOC119099719 [Pollicipes pollicipes]
MEGRRRREHERRRADAMLVDKKRASRPSSMVFANYGQLRTHDDLQSAGSPTSAPRDNREMSPSVREGGGEDACTLKKGVIWYCKDTLLSRWNWKERYFILTKDYLSCFKKAKSQYSDMGAFLFKLPLASLCGVEWDRLRGMATVAIIDPKEGRLLIRSTQDVLDHWYKVLKKATEGSKERRRVLRMSSSNLSTLSSGSGTPRALRSSLSDSSPAIDRLCERVEREVWGGGGSAGRLMRRQKSEMDAGLVLRRQLHYASQKRLNRQSMRPEMDIYNTKQKATNDVTLRNGVNKRHNDSLDSAGHSPSTTPSKSSMSSTEGAEVVLRRAAAGGATGSPQFGAGGAPVVLRTSSVRRRGRGRAPAGVHGDQIRPHSILCETPSDPTEVVLRRKERAPQPRQDNKLQNRRSCDLSLIKRRSAYLTQYEY